MAAKEDRRVGRPTKLTPEVQEAIVTAVLAGSYLETAAAAAGINRDTLYHWLRTGARSNGGIQRAFSDAVKKALAESEIRLGAFVRRAAPVEWQAAAWMLERKFPDRYGRREKITIEMKVREVKVQVYTVVVQQFVALFNEANQLPDLDQRRAMFALGADRIVSEGFEAGDVAEATT